MAKLVDVIKNSLEIDTAKMQLVNDEDAPGNSQYYGTDGAGAKGYHDFPAAAAHDLGGASHNADTLADLNTKISDATLTGKHIVLNEQADSYTLVLGDDGKLIDMAKGTAQTLTVPKNSSVAFPTGTQIIVRQKGAGQVTIAPVDGDVTLNSAGPALKTVDQYSVAGMIKVATDTWAVFGDLEA
jgi:hypothetical protein